MGRISCENNLCKYRNYDGDCLRIGDVKLSSNNRCSIWEKESVLKCASTDCSWYSKDKNGCALASNYFDEEVFCTEYNQAR